MRMVLKLLKACLHPIKLKRKSIAPYYEGNMYMDSAGIAPATFPYFGEAF